MLHQYDTEQIIYILPKLQLPQLYGSEFLRGLIEIMWVQHMPQVVAELEMIFLLTLF